MTNAFPTASDSLKTTPLHRLHIELGGKMVPFAGYDMPVQYPSGILSEHNFTRNSAGLFDVSHMGQAMLSPAPGSNMDTDAALERLVPGDIQALKPGRLRYTLLLNDQGGIRDDLMVTRPADPALAGKLYLVVNAACKDVDFAYITAALEGLAVLEVLDDRALLALQGPAAVDVLETLAPAVGALKFMQSGTFEIDGSRCFVSRSGYTGEDGFELSVPAESAEGLARKLLQDDRVVPVGLGARDSLRLEAGLCLYGHDIDETTTPIEAGLAFTINKRRREAADFPGAAIILGQLNEGAPRQRVGIRPQGRTIAREGTKILDTGGTVIGQVTSGGFAPTAGGAVAMGYVATKAAAEGTEVNLKVRDRIHAAQIVNLPFVTKSYSKN